MLQHNLHHFQALFFGSVILALLIACKLNAHFAKPVDTEDISDSESNSLVINFRQAVLLNYSFFIKRRNSFLRFMFSFFDRN